jgi:hypothetical protein
MVTHVLSFPPTATGLQRAAEDLTRELEGNGFVGSKARSARPGVR